MKRLVTAALVVLAMISIASAAPKPKWKQLSPPAAMPEPTRTGQISVDDFTMHYAVYGDDQKPPLVLLHGGMGSGDDFAAQIPALSARFWLIVPDARGHGRSSRSKRGISYHRMAEDVLVLLDDLGITRPSFVGWSDGGIIALDLAIHHPDRVDRVIVTGTNYARRGTRAAGKGTPFDAYYARCVAEYKRLAPDPDALPTFRKDLRAMWKTEPAYTDDQLRSIKARLLVAHAEHDEIIRRPHAETLAALVPHATFTLIPSVSHFALWQDPAAFNQLVLDFLR